MTIKPFLTASLAALLASPAFAHAGDHSAVHRDSFLQHLSQSPFHILVAITVGVAVGVTVWNIRSNRIARRLEGKSGH